MITLTDKTLADILQCPLTRAAAWAVPLQEAMARFDMATPLRAAHFLGQIGHESAALSRVEENLNYSRQRLLEVFGHRIGSTEAGRYANNPQALANRVYADRNGNGPESSGDGWKYRGRAPLQITGKSNYAAIAALTGLPLLADPDRLLTPAAGALASAAWWQSNGLNALADQDDVLAVGRRVNLGTTRTTRLPNGHADRVARTRRAKSVLGIAA